MLVAYKLLW